MKSYKRLSPETRAVIEVVREALDVPAAAPYPGDQERRAEILDARIRHLRTHLATLVSLAEQRDGGRVDVLRSVDSLRAVLAAYPATGYSHAGDIKNGESR